MRPFILGMLVIVVQARKPTGQCWWDDDERFQGTSASEMDTSEHDAFDQTAGVGGSERFSRGLSTGDGVSDSRELQSTSRQLLDGACEMTSQLEEWANRPKTRSEVLEQALASTRADTAQVSRSSLMDDCCETAHAVGMLKAQTNRAAHARKTNKKRIDCGRRTDFIPAWPK